MIHANPSRVGTRRAALVVVAACAVAACSGCAFLNRDNTPLLNAVEKHMVPKTLGKRIATFPVVFPVGLAAVVVDAVVIHPATVIDDAWHDTKEGLWDDTDWGGHYVYECVALPWRSVGTPVVFTLDFVFRSMFDIPGLREEQADAAALVEAEKLLADGKPEQAVNALSKVSYWRLKPGQKLSYALIRLKAARQSGRYELLDRAMAKLLMKSEYADQLKALLQELRQSKDPFKRWQAFVLDKDLAPSDAERRAAMLKILKDPNPVVRHRAMMYVWEPTKELMAALERVEREDPEPMNRALAAKIIRSANHK